MPFIPKTISIMIGSFLVAVGVNVFLVPYELLDGGSIGIGLIVHYLTNIQVGLVMILVNIPIFLFSWYYNRSFFYNSLHGLLFSSFLIDLLYPLHSSGPHLYLGPLASAVVGGTVVGSGIGMMLRFNTSSGGTDLLGLMFARRMNVNPGIIIFVIDFFIVSTGSSIISNGSLLLSCLTVICVGTTTSLVSAKKRLYR
jgi:uncharacterized membrane-anchored protein YitT (DUF2179 family)